MCATVYVYKCLCVNEICACMHTEHAMEAAPRSPRSLVGHPSAVRRQTSPCTRTCPSELERLVRFCYHDEYHDYYHVVKPVNFLIEIMIMTIVVIIMVKMMMAVVVAVLTAITHGYYYY